MWLTAMMHGVGVHVWLQPPLKLLVPGSCVLAALPLGPDGLPLPEAPDVTPPAAEYLVYVAERDLKTLLPLLPRLAKVDVEAIRERGMAT